MTSSALRAERPPWRGGVRPAARYGRGGVLLERNPFRGYRLPREKNPRRVVLAHREYEALLRVATDVDWRFHVAQVLAHETGHRAGAIAALRWSDIDSEAARVTWRAENEKTGYEHVARHTPPQRTHVGRWASDRRERESPTRGRNLKRGFRFPQWAWVDLNVRPHAYQVWI